MEAPEGQDERSVRGTVRVGKAPCQSGARKKKAFFSVAALQRRFAVHVVVGKAQQAIQHQRYTHAHVVDEDIRLRRQ